MVHPAQMPRRRHPRFTTESNNSSNHRRFSDTELHALKAEFEAFRHTVEDRIGEMADGVSRLWQRLEDWIDKAQSPKYGLAIALITVVSSIMLGIGTMALSHLQSSMQMQFEAFANQIDLISTRQRDALITAHEIHTAADLEQDTGIRKAHDDTRSLERRLDTLRIEHTRATAQFDRDIMWMQRVSEVKHQLFSQRSGDRFTGSMWNLAKERIDMSLAKQEADIGALANRITELEAQLRGDNQ